jgi:hypothetical protein
MPTQMEEAMFFLDLRIKYWNVSRYYASDRELYFVFKSDVDSFYNMFKKVEVNEI